MKSALLALAVAALATSAQAADPVRFTTQQFADHVARVGLYDRASLCVVEFTDGFLLRGHHDKAAISGAVGFGCANTLASIMPRVKAQATLEKAARQYLDRLDRAVAR